MIAAGNNSNREGGRESREVESAGKGRNTRIEECVVSCRTARTPQTERKNKSEGHSLI